MVYDGFISYSHAADDLLAPRLQAGLQRFAKPWWKRRALRIFRDESSLSANPHLWSSITDALDQSGWFVLLLSPDAAESPWVNNEVEYWLEHKDPDRIIPVLTDGDFTWSGGDVAGAAAPPALQGAFADEPRWVDLRFASTDEQLDLNNPTFSAAIADIASAIRGIPKDELESEEVRQHRRTVRTAWAAGFALVALVIVASAAAVYAIGQQNRANDLAQQEATARQDAEVQREAAEAAAQEAEAQQEAAEAAARQAELATLISRSAAQSAEDSDLSLLLALEAHRRAPGPETEQAVLNALGSSTIANRVSSLSLPLDPSGSCEPIFVSLDGTTLFGMSNGQLITRDPLTGTVVEHGPPPAPCVRWFADEQADRRWAGTPDGLRMWFGPFDGPWEVEKEFAVPTFVAVEPVKTTNRLLVGSLPDDGAVLPEDGGVLTLLDGRTGEPVGTQISGGVDVLDTATNRDGSLIAVGFGIPAGRDGDGLTIIVDGDTGEEIFHINIPLPAAALAFDDATGELIAGIIDGTILTVDLATGEIVSDVEATTTVGFLGIGIRPDGVIVAVSDGQVELIDRRTGPVGQTVELRNVIFATVRPDDTVLTVTGDLRVEILDLNGNALVEQTWEVDSFAEVSFNEGRAGAINWPNGNPEIIDLATGDRSTIELITPEGDRYAPFVVYADVDGIWAIDIDADLTRWEGEQMVERIDLGSAAITGTRYIDMFAVVSQQGEESRVVHLVNLERGASGVVLTVAAPEASTAHPTLDGGVHILNDDGTLHTYDSAGALTGEVETGLESGDIQRSAFDLITIDPASGKLAIAIREGGVLVVDPATGEMEPLPGIDSVSNLGFARNGELLAITNADGTVRLWDVVRGASAGLIWDGSGSRSSSPSWYDESTDSIWVVSSGKLLKVPLNPQRWVERACEIVGRDLTQDEWDRFVPGDEPLHSACG